MFGQRSRRTQEFTTFVDSSARYLARTAYLLTGSQDLADDLVQEALTRTYAAWDRVRVQDATAYARRVLVNLTIDRHRRSEPVPLEWSDRPDAVDAHARSDDADEVARMLAGLTPRQRRIVVLRYFDDLTEAQTAECLGISVGTVKSACSRALASLREQYTPATNGEPS
ncbi:SigE family RNA polymerase sigma factor [Micropruina sonneratiae]|uniref:SigE family RNA polymerase sigma factor n=1 Tax=Micropruina sonneratiae TaxID=2986940 RepID=UPI002226F0ED|nr:SigE family RNA polymerase sigma factor [Micropruina sp. KQZ13P-5]MCW3158819.1 SigE family RNA polymerase sigma factor [Micropruina sp. KQZ13P-5]